jgi:hypothetical protein
MTVKELLSRTSSHELAEWMAYYQLEPFGEERGDLRSGIISSVIANVNRGKGTAAYTPRDFMPFIEKQEKEEEDLEAILRRINK